MARIERKDRMAVSDAKKGIYTMKKLYIYSLEYDYKKQKYVVQMDYLFATDQGSHYQPVDVPEKRAFTKIAIYKRCIGSLIDSYNDFVVLEKPEYEKAKRIFKRMIEQRISVLMGEMYRYEEMKIAVEDFKQEECEDYETD